MFFTVKLPGRNFRLEKEISLSEILQAALDKRLKIGLFSAAIAALVVGYSLIIEEKVYETSILISYQLKSSNAASGSMGSLTALAGLAGSSKEKGEEEALGILTSITFLNKFIDKHQLTKDLNISPEDLPKSKAKKLKDMIFVVRERGSPLVKVRLRGKDPVLIAQWSNLLIEELNSDIKDKDINTANNQNAYLKIALAKESNKTVKEQIAKLMEINYQILATAAADTDKEYAYEVIDKAYIPTGVYSPNLLLRLILSLLFSGLIASMWFIYREVSLKFKLP